MTQHTVLLDKCKTISVGYLLSEGYLRLYGSKKGTVAWRRGASNRWEGMIDICVKMGAENGLITFCYTIDDEWVQYSVEILSRPANIGKGVIFYFRCPFSGQLCKNLYLIGKYFVHRQLYSNCYYSSQTYSANTRQLKKCFEILSHYNDLQKVSSKRYFKPHYKGETTKALLTLISKKDRLHRRCNSNFYEWLDDITKTEHS